MYDVRKTEGRSKKDLLPSIVSKSGGSKGSMGHMGGLNGLTSGLGDRVLHWGTGDLGDDMAVLNLDGDNLDLGVIHTVLSGDITASTLHIGGYGVGNSMGSDGGNRGSSQRSSSIWKTSKVLGIGIGLSLSFTLTKGMVASSYNSRNRCITDGVSHLLADLLIFNLLSINCLCGAYILGGGYAVAGLQDFIYCLAVGSRNGCSIGGSQWSSQVLRVSLGISLRLGGGTGEGQEARDGKYLHLV